MSDSTPYAGKRRIQHKDGRHGVVLEDDGCGSLHILWGTVNRRNNATGEDEAIQVTEWVPWHAVTTSVDPVYFGTDGEHNRALVYNPMDHL